MSVNDYDSLENMVHNTKSYNFEVILNTSLEKYYDKLVDDEIIFHKKPTNEKIYIDCRVISEALAKNAARKYGFFRYNEDLNNVDFDMVLGKIRHKLPKEIKENFYNIKKDGNKYAHPSTESYTLTVEEIFKEFYSCLLWYLKNLETNPNNKYNCDFIIPQHKINENEERYLKIIEEEKREHERLIEEYKVKLAKKEEELRKTKESLEDAERDSEEYKKTIVEKNKEIRQLKDEVDLLNNSQEIEELKKGLKELEDNLSNSMINNGLLNQKIFRLTETLESKEHDDFEASKELIKIHDLRESISVDLKDVSEKIDKASIEVRSFKAMLEEDANIQFSKYQAFYKSFVKLEGEQLRKIYITLEKLNIGTLLITSIKNKFSKSDADELQKFIDFEAYKLNSSSDEEIKLKLYYKLMEISGINSGCVADDTSFKGNLDKVVEFAYSTLENKKGFKVCGDKLKSINFYYMEKVIYDFEEKYNSSNDIIQNELIDTMYNNFEKLPEDQKIELYEKLNIKNASEDAVKASMKSLGPSFFLSTMVGIGGFASYTTLSSIIFGFSQLLGVTFSFGVYTGAASLLSFLTGPFMIFLLIADGFFVFNQSKKQKADLVSMIVMQICVSDTSFDNKKDHEIKYDSLANAWKEKRSEFDIYHNEKTKVIELVNDINERISDVENRLFKAKSAAETLKMKLKLEGNNFKIIIGNSPKAKSLKSYKEYAECEHMLLMMSYKKTSKISSVFLVGITNAFKDGAQEYKIKKRISELENILLAEAITSDMFLTETSILRNIRNDLTKEESNIVYLKSALEAERNKLTVAKKRLSSTESKLINIKKEFYDIENDFN